MRAKAELNTTEVLVSTALIDSKISHGEFVLVNNVPKEYSGMEEESKTSNDR